MSIFDNNEILLGDLVSDVVITVDTETVRELEDFDRPSTNHILHQFNNNDIDELKKMYPADVLAGIMSMINLRLGLDLSPDQKFTKLDDCHIVPGYLCDIYTGDTAVYIRILTYPINQQSREILDKIICRYEQHI